MDSFFGIGPTEFLFIAIFALIFLGPERLPQVMREVVGFLRKARTLTDEVTQQVNAELGDLKELDPRRQVEQILVGEPDRQQAQSGQTTAPAMPVQESGAPDGHQVSPAQQAPEGAEQLAPKELEHESR